MGDLRGGAAWAAGTEGDSKGERQGAAAARGRASRRSAPNSLGRARRGRGIGDAAAAVSSSLPFVRDFLKRKLLPGGSALGFPESL